MRLFVSLINVERYMFSEGYLMMMSIILYIQRNGRLAVVKWLVVVHMGELIKR
jgi:hypothetical protein